PVVAAYHVLELGAVYKRVAIGLAINGRIIGQAVQLCRRIVPRIARHRDHLARTTGAAVIGNFHTLRAESSGGGLNAFGPVGLLGWRFVAAGRFIVTGVGDKTSEVAVK